MNMEQYSQKSKKPVKLINVRPSKYESSEAIHNNKKYWTSVFNKLDDANSDAETYQANLLSDALPRELCIKVCNILNIGVPPEKTPEVNKEKAKQIRKSIKEPLLSFRKTLYLDRELDSDTDVEIRSRSEEDDVSNVHVEFLMKPEREQVTWETRYLEPEREDEKSLVKRADDLTNKIAEEFSDYIKQLGGDQQSQLFTPKAIKELFQIEFDTHVARSLQVVSKELPTVEENVAKTTGEAELSRYAALEREISKDIKAEKRPDYLLAFHRRLPRQDCYHNPHNNTQNLWRSARHVPKDLVTLKTVWEGITNLRSVKEYCRWMIEHPEYRRAPYLNSLGMFDPAVLDMRLTFELQQQIPSNIAGPNKLPGSVEYLQKGLSELVDGI